jgi:hypothetical protein
MGLKQLWQAARVVRSAVHGVEQQQISQLGTTANVALRKDELFERRKDLAQSKVTLIWHNILKASYN